MTTPTNRGYVLGNGQGENLWWESQLHSIKASSSGLGLVDAMLEAGSQLPMHVHTREDEFIYVFEGTITAYVGEDMFTCGPGGFVFMPRDVPHTFAIEEPGRARALLMYTPNGFEKLFSQQRTAPYRPGVEGPAARPHDPAVLAAALEELGVTVTGPHPRAAA